MTACYLCPGGACTCGVAEERARVAAIVHAQWPTARVVWLYGTALVGDVSVDGESIPRAALESAGVPLPAPWGHELVDGLGWLYQPARADVAPPRRAS